MHSFWYQIINFSSPTLPEYEMHKVNCHVDWISSEPLRVSCLPLKMLKDNNKKSKQKLKIFISCVWSAFWSCSMFSLLYLFWQCSTFLKLNVCIRLADERQPASSSYLLEHSLVVRLCTKELNCDERKGHPV